MTSPSSRISAHRNPRRTRRRPRALGAAAVLTVALLASAGCGIGDGDGAAAERGSAAQQDRGDAGAAAGDEKGAYRPGEAGVTGDTAGPASPGGERKAPVMAPTHVIRTATLRVRVKDVPSALGRARTAAENAGGYVGDETTERSPEGHEQSRLVIRVPQDAYEELLDELAGTGRLLGREVEAKDVTDQVVDVESRVKSQRASVARVRELMDRAAKLSDIVTLEGELSTRQTELEALLAQQASLKERTAMATVTLELSETETAEEPDDETSFVEALAGGWNAFVTALRWLAVAVGAVLPFAAALAVLLLLWRFAKRFLPRRAPGPAAGHAPAWTAPAPADRQGARDDREGTRADGEDQEDRA